MTPRVTRPPRETRNASGFPDRRLLRSLQDQVKVLAVAGFFGKGVGAVLLAGLGGAPAERVALELVDGEGSLALELVPFGHGQVHLAGLLGGIDLDGALVREL